MPKHCLLALILLCILAQSKGQYYLRGEVRDEKGRYLEGARITIFSKGTYPFTSGSSGTFGIPSSSLNDTIFVYYDGFEPFKKAIDPRLYQVITLKMMPAMANLLKNKLTSRTKDFTTENRSAFTGFGESYSTLVENDFIEAETYPETGFSLNIDRASYSNIRRFLNNEMTVPTDAVRIEELLNYFDLRGKNKKIDEHKFLCQSTLTSCPWNLDNQLLFLQLQAPKVNLDTLPPSNLVFLIDVSGSMDKPNRLPMLQAAFKLFTENLRAKDTITIVTYGGGVHIPLLPTSGADKEKIFDVIDSLYADGDTPGENAIRTAYDMAKHSFIKNGNNRIILATDGDFNVGQTSERDLDELVSYQRQSGIYLTCLGVGMGNYKDSKLETLAKKGNGNFAYLDNIQEAEKVLIQEFTKTIYAVANDAYAAVNFNREVVKEYRLIGFDNKADAINDSTSEIEGGEVGSGHNMMAVFELVPNTANKDSLNKTLATIKLQYRLPKQDHYTYQDFTLPYQSIAFENADSCYRFATAITMFGSILKHSKFSKYFKLDDVLSIANSSADPNSRVQQEFISLVQKASKVYGYKKKKRRFFFE
ncbi:MAG: von Willebrand factor type A domain-containing protein [Bacteroidota bacterium]|nr:von Willebrand factor type A domain-containing protein [Bacteroidota bacterium]